MTRSVTLSATNCFARWPSGCKPASARWTPSHAWGGDEFAVVQRNVKEPQDALLTTRRIIEIVGAPYDINGHRISIGISIGISLAPGDGLTSEKLLKNSDVALYRAKADGRGTWRFFEPEMDARLQARLALWMEGREGNDHQ